MTKHKNCILCGSGSFEKMKNYEKHHLVKCRSCKFIFCELIPTELELDFTPYPDLAQTLVVLCACVGIRLKATGLESLLIKETNRLLALSTELEKIGVHSAITSNSIAIEGQIQLSDTPAGISTYQDHRMAMAFSMVSLLRPIRFDNEKVVSKSFPSFFSELAELFVP